MERIVGHAKTDPQRNQGRATGSVWVAVNRCLEPDGVPWFSDARWHNRRYVWRCEEVGWHFGKGRGRYCCIAACLLTAWLPPPVLNQVLLQCGKDMKAASVVACVKQLLSASRSRGLAAATNLLNKTSSNREPAQSAERDYFEQSTGSVQSTERPKPCRMLPLWTPGPFCQAVPNGFVWTPFGLGKRTVGTAARMKVSCPDHVESSGLF